jgi:nucleotide-binding universal stress UspA family protein
MAPLARISFQPPLLAAAGATAGADGTGATQLELLRRLEDHLRRPRSGSAYVLVPPGAEDLQGGPIVCAVDSSSDARRAAHLARALADELGAPLVLVHPIACADDARRGEQRELRAVDARAHRAALHAVTANVRRVIGARPLEVLRGPMDAQSLLTEFAREQEARLLVVGSRAATSEPWLAREAPCPVVVLLPAPCRRRRAVPARRLTPPDRGGPASAERLITVGD